MTRIGYADIPENAIKIEKISKIPNLVIEGMFTHFARADETDRSPALVQLDRYLRFAELLEKEVFIFRYVTAPTVQVSSVFRKQISMSFVPVSPFTVFIRQRR